MLVITCLNIVSDDTQFSLYFELRTEDNYLDYCRNPKHINVIKHEMAFKARKWMLFYLDLNDEKFRRLISLLAENQHLD